MKKKLACTGITIYVLLCATLLHGQTSPLNKIVNAFNKTIKDNPQDTSQADLSMKILGNIIGGNGVSAADSAAAIQTFMSAKGGNGVHYQYITVFTAKKNGTNSDTSNLYYNENGEGRSEMNLPSMMGVKGRNSLVVLAHASRRQYSLTLDGAEKTYSLNVIDSSLINGAGGKYQVTKIGNENMQGYNCIHSKVVSTSGTGIFSSTTSMDIWTSTSVPGFLMIKTVMVQSITPTILQALDKAGCGGFFVKMISQGKDYSMTMALANAEQQSLPASLFRIPAGYAQSNQNMLSHMMGANK